MAKKERASGLELLRIIALLAIFWMHGASSYVNNELSAWLCILIETVGNIGVPIFILISGYFGVRLKPVKMIQLDMMLVFYAWLGLALRFVWGEWQTMGGEEILSYIFPVIGRNSWYFTCYFALAFLSPYLNLFLERLDKQTFRRMLLTMLIIFSGITTFCFFDITQDGGKGIVNMMLIYCLGRYLRMYEEELKYKKSQLAGAYLAITGCCFALNGALYVVTGTMQNRFARDNTLFTIFGAVCVFLIFKEIHFTSPSINRAAAHVPAAFMMEWTLRGAITYYLFDYLAWRESSWHELILLGISVVLVIAGIAVDAVRVKLLGRVEEKLATTVYGTLKRCIPPFS